MKPTEKSEPGSRPNNGSKEEIFFLKTQTTQESDHGVCHFA
jgi:hypothetical protein